MPRRPSPQQIGSRYAGPGIPPGQPDKLAAKYIPLIFAGVGTGGAESHWKSAPQYIDKHRYSGMMARVEARR